MDYECPKCKTEYNAVGCYDDDNGEHDCDECGFKFVVSIEYEPEYSASCVTCEFGDKEKIGTRHFARQCIHCGAVDLDSIREMSES